MDQMCEILEAGRPLTLACRRVGISDHMPYKWRLWASQGREEYIEITNKLSIAQAKGADSRIDNMIRASEDGDVRATQWLLEHLYPWLIDKPGDAEPATDEQGETEEQRLAREYTAADRLQALAEAAKELGLDNLGQRPVVPQSVDTVALGERHKLELIRTALFTRLNGHLEGQDREETIAVVTASTGCTRADVQAAATYLGVDEQYETLRGAMETYTWKLTGDRVRQTSDDPDISADDGREAETTSDAETPGSGLLFKPRIRQGKSGLGRVR